MGSFSRIPDEISEMILKQLCVKDLLACAATCRRLKSLVDVSPTLRLIVELGLEGFRLSDSWLSGDSSCPPTQLRQEFTLEQQKKKKFKFTHHVTGFFPATRGSNASSQFINGILGYVTPANGSEDNQDLIFWDLRCSIDSLPSTRRRYPPAAENWIHLHENLIDPLTRHRLEADLMYFTWDQSQDLLVLFERGVEIIQQKVHFRSFFTDAAHPLASQPAIGPLPSCRNARIYSSYLILQCVGNQTKSMRVYNWRSAECLYVMNKVNSFHIINPEFILVASSEEHELVPESEEFTLMAVTLAEGVLHCIFRLPIMRILWIDAVNDSYQLPGEIEDRQCGEPSDHYTYHPGDDRVVVINIHIGDEDYSAQIRVAVSIYHIIAFLSPTPIIQTTSIDPTRNNSFSRVRVLEWQQWGPPATRWFPYVSTLTVCGSRLWITRPEYSRGGVREVAQIFDFGQQHHYYQRRMAQSSSSSERLSKDGSVACKTGIPRGHCTEHYGLDTTKTGKDGVGAIGAYGWLQEHAGISCQEKTVTKEWIIDTDLVFGAPASTPISCRLPFRVFTKDHPEVLGGAFPRFHLGTNGIAVIGYDGVVHVFLF